MSKYLARAILLALAIAAFSFLLGADERFLIAFGMTVVGTALLVGLGLGLAWLIDQAFPD